MPRIFNFSSLRYFYNLSFVVFVLHNFSPNVCIEFGCLKQLSRRKSVEKLREKRGYLCSFFSAYVFSECWRTICQPKGIKKLPSWALLHLAENPKCGRIMCSLLVRMYSAQIFSLSMTDYLFRSADRLSLSACRVPAISISNLAASWCPLFRIFPLLCFPLSNSDACCCCCCCPSR